MARVDLPPDERDSVPLILENLVDCDVCDTTFDVVYVAPDGVFDMEDLTTPPSQEVECPNCGEKWERAWEGYYQHQDQSGD